MAIHFVCPFCHTRTRVDDRYAGAQGPCVECGKIVTIPSTASTVQRMADARNLSPVDLPGPASPPSPALPSTTSKSSSQRPSRTPLGIFIGVLLSLSVLGSLGMLAMLWIAPNMQQAFKVRQRTLGMTNIQQIAQALNTYRQTHGSYPTPVVVDANGKPLYSWRVLILPQLGYDGLFRQYQLDQTWDSPTNLSLIGSMPPIFACPSNHSALALNASNFALITGTGTLFPASNPLDPNSMSDGDDETLLVVETRDGSWSWTEPIDLNRSAGIKLGTRPMIDMGGNYSDCVIAATVDGQAIAIRPNIPQTTLDALITPNGKESVDMKTVTLEFGKSQP